MNYQKINASQLDSLWELQKLYKAKIGEDEPMSEGKQLLEKAITDGIISFYGV